MSKLAKACELSFNDWLATFPEIIPEAECSKKHEKWKKKLFDKMRNDHYHRLTTKTIKAMLIAAILCALLMSAFVFPSSREAIIDTFDIFSTYNITKHNNNYVNDEINIGYIPEGYELVEIVDIGKNSSLTFGNVNGEFFTILKQSSSMKVEFNTEDNASEKIIDNTIEYTYCEGTSSINNLIWTKNDYVYRISGMFTLDELLEIAQSVE